MFRQMGTFRRAERRLVGLSASRMPEPTFNGDSAECASARCELRSVEFSAGPGGKVTSLESGDPLQITAEFDLRDEIVFDCGIQLMLTRAQDGAAVVASSTAAAGWDMSYLPRGSYRLQWITDRLPLPAGRYAVRLVVNSGSAGALDCVGAPGSSTKIEVKASRRQGGKPGPGVEEWRLSLLDPAGKLSWQQGKDNWFYKHFDHAARVIINYMLDDSPALKGRILDVGCGDGITDLGVFLRKRPELLVGIDVESNFRELPRLMREYGIPPECLSDRLVFRGLDAAAIPYPDDYFDVVLSWGSLEHVAGGYMNVLNEIRRVLKRGGLLFLHPGLYYSSLGHHLGEFTQEPFAHLKKKREELKEIVFTAQPTFMDRGGLRYGPADFWRYYSELNKITVSGVERDLRRLGFEFKKAAVRSEDLVTYTEDLQQFPIQDLCTQEIYLALVNRKDTAAAASTKRPAGGAGQSDRVMSAPEATRFDYSQYELGQRDADWTRAQQAEWVRNFAGCRRVLDIACGQGVFLELLHARGIPAIGIERNQAIVEAARAKGLDIILEDAFSYLRSSRDSFDGIFCSHFLEHLPFAEVLALIELIEPRLEIGGKLVVVLPNPESIRMHLFGFWRDPEHVRFYHPELIEGVCRHYGLNTVWTNRRDPAFVLPRAPGSPSLDEGGLSQPLPASAGAKPPGRMRKGVRMLYGRALQAMRLASRADLAAVEARSQEQAERLVREVMDWTDQWRKWAEAIGYALDRVWAWPDNAVLVCEKTGSRPAGKPG